MGLAQYVQRLRPAERQVSKRMRPTIVDVAREAGVSAATVSNAINNRRYVEARTKVRIDAAAARLGYTPNVHARRLRTTGIGTIGLFSSMPFAISGRASRLGFFMEIAATAAVSALEGGFALMLVPPLADGVARLDELAIDAALIVEPSADDPYVTRLRERGIPLVTIGKHIGASAEASSVDIRSAETARLLLEHLRAMSARRIALVTGTARRNSYVETEDAFVAHATANRMEPVIVRIDENDGEDAANVATRKLMRDHPLVDGILAAVDTFASGSLRALAELGIAVPDAVRVATRYDGHRARESTPPLTAVDMHLDDVAASAIELLLEQLHRGPPGRTAVAPRPALIARRSTGAGS